MPEVVDPAGLTDRCGHRRLPDTSAEVSSAERFAFRRCEGQPRIGAVLGDVCCEYFDQERRQRHGAPRGLGLGRPEREMAAHFGQRLFDTEAAPQEVDPLDAKRGEFPEAEPGVRGAQHQCAVARVDGVGECGDLVAGEQAHLVVLGLGQADAAGGRLRDESTRYRGSEGR